jgi:hypothetical protein
MTASVSNVKSPPTETPLFSYSPEEIQEVQSGFHSFCKKHNLLNNKFSGFSLEDFIQSCWVTFLLGQKNFDPSKGSLYTFSWLCARTTFCGEISRKRAKSFFPSELLEMEPGTLVSEKPTGFGKLYGNSERLLLSDIDESPISKGSTLSLREYASLKLNGASSGEVLSIIFKDSPDTKKRTAVGHLTRANKRLRAQLCV